MGKHLANQRNKTTKTLHLRKHRPNRNPNQPTTIHQMDKHNQRPRLRNPTMKNFHHYNGDWIKGFTFIIYIKANKLTDADTSFKQQLGYSPQKTGISVTLEPKPQPT